MTVTLQAHAKINLYLDVVGRRENGYHDIVSVMQAVSLADTLTVTRTRGEGIALKIGGAVLAADDSNLVVRAAKAYFAAAKTSFGVETVLEKQIPMQAGLGGGSADAAAMLHALNKLDGERFSLRELAAIGASIGADVPFCVVGGTALCRGIGEVIEPIENRLDATLVVAIGRDVVSTPAAFGALDRRYDNYTNYTPTRDVKSVASALAKGDANELPTGAFNAFEAVIEALCPSVAEIKRLMKEGGAILAQMSGSGPAVFGVFSDPVLAQKAKKALDGAGYRAFVCRMVYDKA